VCVRNAPYSLITNASLFAPVFAVVTFNKGVFNLVAKDRVDRYIARLQAGELIRIRIAGVEPAIPIFLTYPTG
jgi:hypothetical protein